MADSSALEDIPGTTVFTAQRAREGFPLNQFCKSLQVAENRARFHADERAYVDEFSMSEGQKQAVLGRDYQKMLDLGGNIYFLAKIFLSDGQTFAQAASSMTGMTMEGYQAMMLAGGRSPDGWRSKAERG